MTTCPHTKFRCERQCVSVCVLDILVGLTNPRTIRDCDATTIEICDASNVSAELIKLRIGLARIAQTLDIDGVHGNKDTPYQEIFQRASTIDREWNTLCGEIVDEIGRLPR